MRPTDTLPDHFLSVPQLMARWAIGRTSIYALVKSADFPSALVLLWDKNDRPRTMSFLLSDVVAYEERHRVDLSQLDFGPLEMADGVAAVEAEPVAPTTAELPAPKRSQPRRKVA